MKLQLILTPEAAMHLMFFFTSIDSRKRMYRQWMSWLLYQMVLVLDGYLEYHVHTLNGKIDQSNAIGYIDNKSNTDIQRPFFQDTHSHVYKVF